MRSENDFKNLNLHESKIFDIQYWKGKNKIIMEVSGGTFYPNLDKNEFSNHIKNLSKLGLIKEENKFYRITFKGLCVLKNNKAYNKIESEFYKKYNEIRNEEIISKFGKNEPHK